MLRSLEARKQVALVSLDLSAAFDTIDHCILLEESHRIGVRRDALHWMSSYLTDRTQCASVDVDFPRGDSASAVDRIRRCVVDVKAWLASRCLLLNEKKTEAILVAAPNNRISQPPPLCIDVCGCSIIASTNIRDLGVQLDSTMSMAAHVSRTCRTA